MANPGMYEEQASSYVLGQLPAAERQEFETCLAQSAELQALVRQLEEGLSALAMASPPRQAPRQAWAQIERAVSRETTQKDSNPGFWIGWWRHGWAAAAGCLVCWLLYALWAHGDHPSVVSPVVSEVVSHPSTTSANPRPTDIGSGAPNTGEAEAALRSLLARTQEISALSGQVANLTKRVTELSQDLSTKRELLSDSNRLKFFQMNPATGGGTGTMPNPPIAPNLQKALFLAMARELGWSPDAAAGAGMDAVNKQTAANNFSPSAITNQVGVDFVDLRSSSRESANASNVSSLPVNESSGLTTSSLSNAIPGFVSGTNAFMAFDPTLMPVGSTLTFLTARSLGQYSAIGTAVLGNNPTVVTVPLAATSWEGGNVTVILSTSAGAYSIIGQFPAPTPVSP